MMPYEQALVTVKPVTVPPEALVDDVREVADQRQPLVDVVGDLRVQKQLRRRAEGADRVERIREHIGNVDRTTAHGRIVRAAAGCAVLVPRIPVTARTFRRTCPVRHPASSRARRSALREELECRCDCERAVFPLHDRGQT